VVLKVTDFTYIAWFVHFMHIVYNSVVVLVVVVVVRNEVIMIILTKECVCSLEIWVMGRKL